MYYIKNDHMKSYGFSIITFKRPVNKVGVYIKHY